MSSTDTENTKLIKKALYTAKGSLKTYQTREATEVAKLKDLQDGLERTISRLYDLLKDDVVDLLSYSLTKGDIKLLESSISKCKIELGGLRSNIAMTNREITCLEAELARATDVVQANIILFPVTNDR